MSDTQLRDFNTQPYTEDESRVCDFLLNLSPDIGRGADPIGFLMASYACLLDRHKWQPIDNAPKTGEWIYALEPTYGHYLKRGEVRGYSKIVVSWVINNSDEGFWTTGFVKAFPVLWLPVDMPSQLQAEDTVKENGQ